MKVEQEWSRDHDGKDCNGSDDEDRAKKVAVDRLSPERGGGVEMDVMMAIDNRIEAPQIDCNATTN